MKSLAYLLRLIDCGLSGLVAGLCFLKTNFDYENRARNGRIAGLGLICLAIAWGSFARRNDSFRPWLPLITLGLCLCLYGMRRPASGEPFFRPREK